jgi:transposase
MIVPASNVQVLVATKPVDFRRGADRLAALVQESLSVDPFCGAIYVFRAKRANRIKILWWDGTGICLLAKRLEEGQFRWPRIADGRPKSTPNDANSRVVSSSSTLPARLSTKVNRENGLAH